MRATQDNEITAGQNNTVEAWLKIGWRSDQNGFEAFTRIGERYFDEAGETGIEYFFLSDYQEHPTATDNEGFPITLDLTSKLWAERFISAMTKDRPSGEMRLVGECGEQGWIVSWAFDRRRG